MDKELINKYYPNAECIKAMKVWKLPQGKEDKYVEMCNNGEYFGQIKKDGCWYEFEKTEDNCYLFGKTTSVVTGVLTEKSANVPHIIDALDNNLPAGTILIGEIYYPGKTSKGVSTIMGCKPEKAIQRQKDGEPIHYYIHDIIKLNGVDLKNTGSWKRYNILKDLFNKKELYKYNFLELAESFTDNLAERTIEALNSGEEGMVLKKKDYVYTPDKRPAWSTIKMKQHDNADVVCIGFCEPTKEYTGKEIDTWQYWLNEAGGYPEFGTFYNTEGYTPITKGYYYNWKTAIEIGAYDENGNIESIGTIASGLTDELREDFSVNPDKYLNQVLRVDCMSLDKVEHTIRHGIFKGFRDDKDPQDCLISEIFN